MFTEDTRSKCASLIYELEIQKQLATEFYEAKTQVAEYMQQIQSLQLSQAKPLAFDLIQFIMEKSQSWDDEEDTTGILMDLQDSISTAMQTREDFIKQAEYMADSSKFKKSALPNYAEMSIEQLT